ncbi:MAG TPA: DUF2569 domain-containing protein [Chthoniobacteraceae bacterium]|jgi:hypothetical protein|nr:DUF2569 domain-containing protein [Chthoniobacteraceae bacterium]
MTYQLDTERYRGLGGWLILVAIGLFVNPIKIGFFIFTTLLPAFSEENWAPLTTPGSESYHPLWAPLLVSELSFNAIIILADLGLLVLFFTRSRKFPKAMIAFYLANLAFVAADFFLAQLIPQVAAKADAESATELGRMVIGTAIWVPYFFVSKRVKATFIEPQEPPAPPPFAPA